MQQTFRLNLFLDRRTITSRRFVLVIAEARIKAWRLHSRSNWTKRRQKWVLFVSVKSSPTGMNRLCCLTFIKMRKKLCNSLLRGIDSWYQLSVLFSRALPLLRLFVSLCWAITLKIFCCLLCYRLKLIERILTVKNSLRLFGCNFRSQKTRWCCVLRRCSQVLIVIIFVFEITLNRDCEILE